ncbi:MAG: HEPN domain-containing protein [Candidatus Pacebacteria bacterium]|nr:HEPN domain-containing protein [Candidatus Paceibacterota bacterium]
MFNWRHYLEVAEENATNPEFLKKESKEGYLRCAISRAYYAAFNCSLEYAKQTYAYDYMSEKTSEISGTHEVLIDFLRKRGDEKISYPLKELKGLRKLSDYMGEHRINEDEVEKGIKIAEEILKKV